MLMYMKVYRMENKITSLRIKKKAMCLGMGAYNTIEAQTAQSKHSIVELKALMIAELCVAMCKM